MMVWAVSIPATLTIEIGKAKTESEAKDKACDMDFYDYINKHPDSLEFDFGYMEGIGLYDQTDVR